jgi:glycerophosphoryl diester phosphodiesterase
VFAAVLTIPLPFGPASAVSKSCTPSPFLRSKPLVIAHASSTYFGPPNTLSMMRSAVRAGADVVDADVRVTSDGVLVASHDDDLTVTTNGSGSLHAHTFAELRRLDAAWTWPGRRHDFALRGTGVTIPTVEEILNAFPNRRVSLEFKTTGGEKAMCTLLRRLRRTSDVYIGSAGDAAVDTFKPTCPEVTTTVTDAMVVDMQNAQKTGAAWCSPSPIGQPPYVIGSRRIVTSESVRWNHAHGMAVYTWTLDDPAQLADAAAAGVDGVYTGRADLARAAFDRRAVATAPPARAAPTRG